MTTPTATRTAASVLGELLKKLSLGERIEIPNGYAAKVVYINTNCATNHPKAPTWIRVVEEENAAQKIVLIEFTEDGETLQDDDGCDIIVAIEIVETVSPGIVTIATEFYYVEGVCTLPLTRQSHAYLEGVVRILTSDFGQ